MKFGSVCSGIEAASCAWHPLGWRASFVSEIEAFPRAVLKHHWKDAPLHGDFTTIRAGEYDPIELLVGGTPCQSFSVAGLRGGLDDERGNLALEYLRLADRLRPRWLVWENVPGVLSSAGGRDFGAILGGMVELGYGVAYRVLDAQFFGVAQRRRRVFVVGHLGDWRRAAAVLFERHSLSGHPAPRRQAREGFAQPVAECLRAGGNGTGGDRPPGTDADTAATYLIPTTYSIMPQNSGKDYKARPVEVAQPVMAGGPVGGNQGGDYIVQPAIAFALRGREGGAMPEMGGDQVGALRAASGGSTRDYVAFDTTQVTSKANRSQPKAGDPCHPLAAGAHPPAIAGTVRSHTRPGSNEVGSIVATSAVRRLTPRECEKLQGFEPDYTLIPWRNGMAPDGPRYKALGNSMAVPVMAWLGRRIEAVDALQQRSAA